MALNSLECLTPRLLPETSWAELDMPSVCMQQARARAACVVLKRAQASMVVMLGGMDSSETATPTVEGLVFPEPSDANPSSPEVR